MQVMLRLAPLNVRTSILYYKGHVPGNLRLKLLRVWQLNFMALIPMRCETYR